MHIQLFLLNTKNFYITFHTHIFAFHAVRNMCTRNRRTTTARRYPCYHDMLVFDIRNVRFVTVEFLELERVISFSPFISRFIIKGLFYFFVVIVVRVLKLSGYCCGLTHFVVVCTIKLRKIFFTTQNKKQFASLE
jgi:hypothetical protein